MVMRNAHGISHRPQMLFHQAAIKAVVASWHGRVGGEHGLPCHPPHRLLIGVTVTLHPPPDRLQRGEGRVPFVEVIDTGSDAHRADSLHPTYSQHKFLADPDTGVATVEPAG